MSKSHVSYDRALGDRYYGRSINPKTAFEIGYEEATQGKGDGSNAVRLVKNNYEQKLADYLKALPEDPDFSTIPNQYRNKLSEYLSAQKNEYVRAANIIDELVVGSQDYMNTMSKMNNIKSSFETLDKQFQLYNTTKKSVIEDIEGQAISLYGENQANVNLLRGIFNEEYDLEIGDNGNLYFIGDDGKVGLNDLPEYGMKDFATAEEMVKMGVQVYQNGQKTGYTLKTSDIMYHQYSNKLKRMIYQGGKNTLMSVLYDGLVGDIVLADDPAMKELIKGYHSGEVGFDELAQAAVGNYMKTLVSQSANGAKSYNVNATNTGNKGGTVTERKARRRIELIDEVYVNLEPNGDLEKLNQLLPPSIRLEWNNGMIDIDKSSGSGFNTELTIDPNSEDAIYQIYRFAGIDPLYWPEKKKKEDNPLIISNDDNEEENTPPTNRSSSDEKLGRFRR